MHNFAVIAMNRNAPSNGNWNQNSRNDAQALINTITFSSIVTLVIVRRILDLTRPLTVRLQKQAMDLLKAKEEITLLKAALRGMQMNLNTRHNALYEEAVALARHVSVQPSMPRIIQRQVHRNNAPAPTPEDYYRINLTTDFLNHALVQLDSRFQDDVFECYKGFSVFLLFCWQLTLFGRIMSGNFETITGKISLIMQGYQQSFGCWKDCERGKRIEEKTSLTV